MKRHLKTLGKTDTWITPKYITESLGKFDLDPCAHTDMPWNHASKEYTIHDDGLNKKWKGRVWLNPPFNQYVISNWMEKMYYHKNGIMLISAACETKRFYDWVWGKASGVCFLDHRPYFRLPDGSKSKSNSGQTMCLITYDEYNLEILKKSNLGIVVKEIT